MSVIMDIASRDLALPLARRGMPVWRYLTAPTFDVVEVQAVRHALRIEHTDDDDLLARYIRTAQAKITRDTQHVMAERSVENVRDHWLSPLYDWRDPVMSVLPGPVSVVQSVQYRAGGILQTLDPSEYTVDVVNVPARIAPTSGSWPMLDNDALNGVVITFTCGYPDRASLPDELVQAIHLLVGHWDAHREAYNPDGRIPAEINLGYEYLLGGFTRGSDQ